MGNMEKKIQGTDMGVDASGYGKTALTDELTGLGNADYIEKNREQLLDMHDGEGQFFLIVTDKFRSLQNEMGILFADEVLCDIARMLRRKFPSHALLGRQGQNEFLVLLAGKRTDAQILKLAAEIKNELWELYSKERIACRVKASIGIACITRKSEMTAMLIERTKKAVAEVKAQGGDGYAFYTPDLKASYEPFKLQKQHQYQLCHMVPRYHVTDYNIRFLADAKDSESAVNLLLKRSQEFYGVDHCGIYVVQEDQRNLYCKYESREDKEITLYQKTIRFSQQGFKDRMERLFHREACYLFKDTVTDRGRLKIAFPDMPECAVVMQVLLCTDETYVGDLFLIDYSGTKIWTEEDLGNLEGFAKVLGYYLMAHRENKESAIGRKPEEGIDPLTGLYNADTFLQLAENYVRGSDDRFVLVYVDVGNFKSINKDMGYDMGDRVLKELARLLVEEVRDAILAGRVYGDQFAVLCRKDTPMTAEEILENADAVNHMLMSKLRKICMDENILIHAGMYHISTKGEMGVALSRAKMAKNIAKQQWSGRMVVYEDWMSDAARKNYELMGNVDAAIANREFRVYLQPKVDSNTMKIIGAEALVRWIKPDGRMIYPDDFIPFFEKNGKIVDVDYYVYEEVFRYIRNRLDAGLSVVPVSMNVSRIHLKNDNFMKMLERLLCKYQVPCEYLEFELTENVYVEKLQQALVFIENIREKHIKVSIDDFGSGYSSLNVISNIPLDILKLDKAFMKRGGELTKKDMAVISHLVKLAKDIDLEVLCEGVETPVQAEFVKNIGCNAWQGYCFAKPMPMAEFDECLNRNY